MKIHPDAYRKDVREDVFFILSKINRKIFGKGQSVHHWEAEIKNEQLEKYINTDRNLLRLVLDQKFRFGGATGLTICIYAKNLVVYLSLVVLVLFAK